jgi:prepilin-type N-terminal cleavage/methylation domain-containing protein
METDAPRRWGVMKACSSTAKAALAPPAAQRGFTLVELLLAVSLGSVVLASLGGGLLLSELKVSATVQRNLYAKDAANRAIDLMRREASFSRFFSWNRLPSGGVLDSCIWATPIIYVQPNNAFICYKTVAPSDLPAAYRSASQGPCVLVRLGPPYKPDGTLDLTATPIVQVLLDGVARTRFAGTLCPATDAFNVTYGSLTSPSTGGVLPLTRDANVAINLASGVRYSFSVRAASNHAYDGRDLYANCTVLSPTGCGSADEASYHFRPKMDSASESIPGSPSRENVFYFQHPLSE